MLLRGPNNVPEQFRFSDGVGEVLRAVLKVLNLYDDKCFNPLVRNPKGYPFGLIFCAVDACMPGEDSEGGYGIVVGNVCAYGRWSQEIWRACALGLMSIFPLKYTAGLLECFTS